MILFSFGVVIYYAYALLVFIIVLSLIIGLHELGHLFFAKKAHILCHEYAIGMGPVIKQWKKEGRETAVSIRAIPFGGFVSMAGEDTNETLLKEEQEISLNLDENGLVKDIIVTPKVEGSIKGSVVSYDLYSKNGEELYIDLDVEGETKHYPVKVDAMYVFSQKERIQIAPYDRCFESKKWWPRFITIFGGPLMNFVIALVLFLIVGLATGVSSDSNQLGEVNEYYPAAGILKAGDTITKLDDENINSWSDIGAYLSQGIKEEVNVTYVRDGVENSAKINTVIFDYRLGLCNIRQEQQGEGFNLKYIYHLLENEEEKGIKVGLVYDKGYVASKAGIKDGDIVLGYYDLDGNFHETNSWNDLISYTNDYDSKEKIKLSVKHIETKDGVDTVETKNIESDIWDKKSLDALNVGASNKVAIGITAKMKFSFWGGIKNALASFLNSILLVFKTLGALFTNRQIHITDLSGPVGIFSAIERYLHTDFLTFVSFVALISANIGVVNLLPIPALDGGRLLFLIIEGITKKKVSKKVDTILNNVMFILLILLFIFITFKDILKLFGVNLF